MTDLPQRLRTARKITQTRVAELLGVSPRVYTRWENGDAGPLFGTVVRIADILNVSLDELAGRNEPNSDAHSHNRNSTACTRKSNSFPTKTRRRW